MPSTYGLTYKDYNRETSRVRWEIVGITAANLVATQALLATLLTAVQAVSIGQLQTEQVVATDTFSSRSPASSNLAQRENKWLVTLEDQVTHRITSNEIPCADLSLLASNSEFLDLSAGEGLALKSAIEAVVKFPGTQNAVFVNSVQFVGRRA